MNPMKRLSRAIYLKFAKGSEVKLPPTTPNLNLQHSSYLEKKKSCGLIHSSNNS